MALWYAVSRGFVLRRCDAPDKPSATEMLRPKSDERVVSAASFALDTEPRPKAEGSHRRKLRWDQRHRAQKREQNHRYRDKLSGERRERFLAKQRLYSRAYWRRTHPNATIRLHKRKSTEVLGNGSGG